MCLRGGASLAAVDSKASARVVASSSTQRVVPGGRGVSVDVILLRSARRPWDNRAATRVPYRHNSATTCSLFSLLVFPGSQGAAGKSSTIFDTFAYQVIGDNALSLVGAVALCPSAAFSYRTRRRAHFPGLLTIRNLRHCYPSPMAGYRFVRTWYVACR